MGSALTTIGLPVALGIIMLGLGLSLTLADFARGLKQPKAVIIALLCQLVLLPAICFGLVLAFQLQPILAVGMMMLAASPGGTTVLFCLISLTIGFLIRERKSDLAPVAPSA
ncbi:hypothetical protein [Microbacterium paraoxydans]|uniref:hypothetical protein n=1 Tax=Microbacterium paraoxydans TaxID=199592 RepID=UPI001CF92FBC|nr:hypothetical protein [Microbacterium paraoxydans]